MAAISRGMTGTESRASPGVRLLEMLRPAIRVAVDRAVPGTPAVPHTRREVTSDTPDERATSAILTPSAKASSGCLGFATISAGR